MDRILLTLHHNHALPLKTQNFLLRRDGRKKRAIVLSPVHNSLPLKCFPAIHPKDAADGRGLTVLDFRSLAPVLYYYINHTRRVVYISPELDGVPSLLPGRRTISHRFYWIFRGDGGRKWTSPSGLTRQVQCSTGSERYDLVKIPGWRQVVTFSREPDRSALLRVYVGAISALPSLIMKRV